MAKNNVHVLTDKELEDGKAYYTFEVKSDMIVIKPVNYNRRTVKPVNESFSVIYKSEGHSVKVTVSPDAIKMWSEKFKTYHLLDIQNAINKLLVIYQNIDEEDVKNLLADKQYIKIRKVI